MCVSSRILLDCPDVVYTYPVNNSNLSFFTSAPGYKDESHAVYKVKLCDQKVSPCTSMEEMLKKCETIIQIF